MKKISNKIFRILHKNHEIEVIVKKNKLSRNYKLTFDKKTLSGLVSIPNYISYKDAFIFAQENSKWLFDQFNEISPLIIINHEAIISFEGKNKKIIFISGSPSEVKLENNSIIVISNRNSHNKILYKWIKNRILENTKKSVSLFSKTLNVKIRMIRLSNSFSYWGSCNSNNEISINWRLIFSPPDVLDYIIAHEMSHIIEFNHGKNFWDIVDKLIPNKKGQQYWLKRNGNYLYRIRFN